MLGAQVGQSFSTFQVFLHVQFPALFRFSVSVFQFPFFSFRFSAVFSFYQVAGQRATG